MESSNQSHTPLFRNPWFYGFIGCLSLLFLFGSVLTPKIRDPWFWQTDDRTVGTDPLSRHDLHQRLKKHPADKGIGNKDAPVTVTEYSNFQCPSCRTYAREYMPHLLREFVQTDKVYYRMRHVPIGDQHPQSLKLAIASECAGNQQRFWSFRYELTERDTIPSTQELLEMGRLLELDSPADFERCVRQGESLETVRTELNNAQEKTITLIPSLEINQTLMSQINSYQAIRRRIQQELRNTGQ